MLLAGLALHAANVAAQPARVVVAHAEDDETSRRLCAEVASTGLAVVDLRLLAGEQRTSAQLAEAEGARAVLRVTSEGIELVVLAAATRAIDLHTLIRGRDARDVTTALRAVEELRARLAEPAPTAEPLPATRAPALAGPVLEAPHAAPIPPAPAVKPALSSDAPAPQATAPARAASEGERPFAPRLWIGPAMGGAASAGGIGAIGLLGARVGVEVSPRVGGSALALLPFASANVSASQGSAEVALTTFAALAELSLLAPRSRFGVELGLGGGAALLAVDGRSEVPGLVARSRTIATPLALAELSWRFRAARELRLRLDLLGGVTMPRPTLRFDGHEVASFGRPLALALLGAEIGMLPGGGAR